MKIKKKYLLKFAILVIITFIFSNLFQLIIMNKIAYNKKCLETIKIDKVIIKPFCSCYNRAKEYILLEIYLNKTNSQKKKSSKNVVFYSVNHITELSAIKLKRHLYEINEKEMADFKSTCDLYNNLRRGKRQKIISFSLYGTDPRYSINLKNIAKRLRFLNYTSRIYYDKSMSQNFRCRLECLYGDVIDFCNVNKFSINLDFLNKSRHEIDISYMHKMMWRFLPIGDSFVEIFMSRDTDSFLSKREIDSVDVWLKSNNIGHIMRGNYFLNKIK